MSTLGKENYKVLALVKVIFKYVSKNLYFDYGSYLKFSINDPNLQNVAFGSILETWKYL